MSPVYSHSRLSNFESCPKKFHFRYILRLPADGESIEGFVGKRVHEVLERLYQVAGEGRVPSLARVLERFNRVWNEQYDPERVRIVRRENDADVYRRMGERCLSTYYRQHYPFDEGETLGLETRVRFSLDGGGRYRMQGVIDRLARARDGAIEIVDYKTSRRMPSQASLDADRQLALYQLALAERYADGQPVRLVWHYLAVGRSAISTRTPEQLEGLRDETIALIDRVEAETHFEPRPGPLCDWCEFRDRCPAFRTEKTEAAEPAQVAPTGAGPSTGPGGQLTLL